MMQHFANHHNKIQFFGYEVANLVLVAQQLWVTRGTGFAPATGYPLPDLATEQA